MIHFIATINTPLSKEQWFHEFVTWLRHRNESTDVRINDVFTTEELNETDSNIFDSDETGFEVL